MRLGWGSQHGLPLKGREGRQLERVPELFTARPDSPASRRMGLGPSMSVHTVRAACSRTATFPRAPRVRKCHRPESLAPAIYAKS
jgi:hypothetical protein